MPDSLTDRYFGGTDFPRRKAQIQGGYRSPRRSMPGSTPQRSDRQAELARLRQQLLRLIEKNESRRQQPAK